MQYQDMQLVFALFDNLSYIIAKVTDGSGSQAAQSLVQVPYKPIIESSSLDNLEIERYHSLVEIVCSKTHVYKIIQNQPQPGNPDMSNGQTLEVLGPYEQSFT